MAPHPDETTLFWHVSVPDAIAREGVMGAAWEDGAIGVEERSDTELVIYAPSSAAEVLCTSLAQAAGEGGVVSAPEPVPEVDWTEQWKVGQGPIVISPRLVVRPSFAEHVLEPGQREIIIDPGQAFGTGGHQSTRLVLEWIDVLSGTEAFSGGDGKLRVLDVGTGSGVLALAAVALGAQHALGFDLDPLAEPEAQRWARENGLSDRVTFFTGPIESVSDIESAPEASDGFGLVLANLLKREVLPIVDEIARRVAPPGGRLILSGLLEADVPEVAAAFRPHGLQETGRRSEPDANGDLWVSPCLERRD